MEWYLAVLRKYAVFTGRARRKEFWMFTLVNVIISVVLGILGRIIGMPVQILGWIYSLAVLIPGIAVGSEAIAWKISDFLKGTMHCTQEDVPM